MGGPDLPAHRPRLIANDALPAAAARRRVSPTRCPQAGAGSCTVRCQTSDRRQTGVVKDGRSIISRDAEGRSDAAAHR
jgi:hypothetical protein